MRTLYAQLFKAHGILPDMLAKQNPFILFKMFDDLNGESKMEEPEIPEELRFFYGM